MDKIQTSLLVYCQNVIPNELVKISKENDNYIIHVSDFTEKVKNLLPLSINIPIAIRLTGPTISSGSREHLL